MRAAMTSIVVLAMLGVASPASASSIWDRVIDPTYADRDYAHRFAVEKEHEAEILDHEADLAQVQSGGMDETFARQRAILLRDAARTILERFGAASSPDVRLRFDLGQILARVPQEYEKARAVLLGAVKMAPTDARASAAWFSIAICDAKLGAREDEAKAYEASLALEDDPVQRALLFGNLAESRMSAGDLEGARAAAETSIALQPLDLAHYTLGVILDRMGDEWGGVQEVKTAISGKSLAILHDPGVFFEPEYEVHYYEALGWLALGRDAAPKTSDWMFDLTGALKQFDQYLQKAPATDRWRKRAQEHVERIEATMNLKPSKVK